MVNDSNIDQSYPRSPTETRHASPAERELTSSGDVNELLYLFADSSHSDWFSLTRAKSDTHIILIFKFIGNILIIKCHAYNTILLATLFRSNSPFVAYEVPVYERVAYRRTNCCFYTVELLRCHWFIVWLHGD